MGEPTNYHEIPEPSRAEAAKIRGARSMVPVADVAAKWRPKSGANLEPYIATLARVANRIIDRETGDAYSVADLIEVVVARVLEEEIGGGTTITFWPNGVCSAVNPEDGTDVRFWLTTPDNPLP